MGLSSSLLKTWLWLTGLSLLAAVATLAPMARWVLAAAILLLALLKARLILARYLDLYRAPGWLAGATLVFAIWTVLAFGLYLIPVLMR
ncbi:cytochrome C oxidase subunit IV family protein [Sedimentitalea todarodis]|uniref:Cytochrome C oxidase subunit IV family protein n=1 Tax=Sedimentitalea todarodis TaxID=1631240 RepID=A0ABU3VGP2_9RHOB|nr:cytochrome C oxidase subunit IV family protein [Sedimentitalea todarodis]MDU9005340.1 cytochrome C oxidase subunit IV family protein [Sedimentitalea todarodis]